MGNVLEPKVLGDSLNLSPVVILFSLTVWTALWGGIGAVLAVPITAIIQILCDQLEFTSPVAAVLRGDIIALMNAYKKLEVPAEDTKKRDKSIPKGLPETQIDDVADQVKKVQKTL